MCSFSSSESPIGVLKVQLKSIDFFEKSMPWTMKLGVVVVIWIRSMAWGSGLLVVLNDPPGSLLHKGEDLRVDLRSQALLNL